MKLLLSLVLLSYIFVYSQAASVPAETEKDPLYLTPYINSGKLEEGRKLAEVKPGKPFIGNVKSYSGLLTVDDKYDSNLFFWYFPSERKGSEVPVLLWNNGWGTASSYGTFLQTGPYDLSTNTLKAREVSWQKYYHVIYIDAPVGTGYSFTNSTEGYSTNLDKLAVNLQEALEQFFKLFPDLAGRELYLTSLSLGGKYIPSLAHRLYKLDNFNLKGIFLGNPLLDLGQQLKYETYLYELGFIHKSQQLELIKKQDSIKQLLKENKFDEFNSEIYNFLLTEKNYIVNLTGLNNVFDYEDNVISIEHYYEFIVRDEVRKALHVSTIPYGDGMKAMEMFGQGMAFSVLGYLEDMINSIKMLFYAGQNDVSITYPKMVETLFTLNWKGKENYTNALRERLYEEDGLHIWGYMRNHGPITDVLIRKAGHSAVTSQPEKVLWLLKNFTDYNRFE